MKLINDPVYLASQSPRRKELLDRICSNVIVIRIDAEENIPPVLSPAEVAIKIAEEKMNVAIPEVSGSGYILTADTIVSCDNKILGKPGSEQAATEMLRLLSGRKHQVYTGFCIYHLNDKKLSSDVAKTDVTFCELSPKEIDLYIKTGSSMDKAGAYGIQDPLGSVFVKSISGCYYNVMGLPLSQVYQSIRGALD